MSAITLRPAAAADAPELEALFRDTILTVNRADYNAAQVQAWAGRAARPDVFQQRIEEQHFLVGERHGAIAGFASVTLDGTHIDLLYVHRNHQRCGVAAALIAALLVYARSQGAATVTSDVSITARPFFEKQGFRVLQEQTVAVSGVTLTNYKMIRRC
ncbi:GNAT family N-acetyltransferase [Flaviaesturariibacter amylovorans]|uniref:GNAT family N-acetyltransferase n=1 Tax=Flaviaesturariibacter amylovorans TaxID=1084520 RepID=A0ABP8GN29_9BACT